MPPRPKMGPPHQKSSFLRWIRGFAKDSRGNALVLSAAAIFPIAAIIGSGLDMSRAYTAQAKMQHACDAAALAARRNMAGGRFDIADQSEGERFFDFNYPSTTMSTQNLTRIVAPTPGRLDAVSVNARAEIPTTLMALFGKETIPISVSCTAESDAGNNDIMLVLDVTESMLYRPTGATSGPIKIEMLRDAVLGMYGALSGSPESRTRYGFLPYSMTTNVARSLRNRDILRETYYLQCPTGNPGDCAHHETVLTPVHIDDSRWARRRNSANRNIRNFRRSGEGCVEERPTIGNGDHPIFVNTTISQDDIDLIARGTGDRTRQWGRFDIAEQHALSRDICPAEATTLRTYGSPRAFEAAINSATSEVGGNTYHDVGMIWGARFLSSTGMFASNNPEIWNGTPVAKHIVFLTDGVMCPSEGHYSAFGVERYEHRIVGPDHRITGCAGRLSARHSGRFISTCATAKTMGMTIWVIALDVYQIDHIRPCASSDGHFFQSDGSDLEDIFTQIGQSISRLRLS